jgi:hypothetical protein
VTDAQWADGKSSVSVLGPADLEGNSFVSENQNKEV